MKNNNKDVLRQSSRAKRNSFGDEFIKKASKGACDILINTREFLLADTILIYYPIKNEISPLPIIKLAHKLSKSVAFPLCDKKSRTLSFKSVLELNELKETELGLFEPSEDALDARITKNTLCIVPALCFSKKGDRLGYGVGYYDRFLHDFEGISAGFSYSELVFDAIPCEEHDIALDMIVTESEVLYIAEEN